MASVVGIDLGNLSSKIGVARRKGIDIITNEVSNRATPSLISFTPRQRFIGEAAKTAETSNFKNTVGSLKRMLGRSLSDPEVAEFEKKHINAELVDVNGTAGVKVNYLGEPATFSYTQLVAAYLGKLRDIAGNELKQTISDVVIAIPGWYTDVQRRAMLDAAQMAGLNPLRLINDTTAIALGYGITKELPESPENARHVCFVDVGHSNFSVAVVAFSQGQLTVKSTAYDRNFGGRDFDYALLQHFATEFSAKYKVDVMSSPKAVFRLATGCERLKKILSANAEAPINVESLMNDIDASSSLTREQFEKLTEHLLTRVVDPVKEAIAAAGLTADQIDAIELVGGSTRIPAVKEALASCFPGKSLSFTLNQEEAVARGATLACASLSPVFRVREFAIHDITPYPIKVSWEKEAGNPDEDTELVVFPKSNPIPSTKILTFYRQGPFELEAAYDASAKLPGAINPWIGKYTVKNVTKPANGDLACVKVKARLNLHGIMNFEGAYMVEEVEREEVTTVGEGEDKKEEKKMVKKLQRTGDCSVIGQYTSLSKSAVDDATEQEGKMHAEDKLVLETEERKNALEEYVYDMRGKLEDRYAIYVQEKEKSALLEGCQEAEDWLYTEEGEDATKSAYVAKLDKLKAISDPVVSRWKENEARPKAAAELREATNMYLSLAQNDSEQYSHIPEEDKNKVIEKCATNSQWLDDKLARQAERPKNTDPVITSAEILKRAEEVRYTGASIMNRPKPRPKTTESTPASGQQTPKEDPSKKKAEDDKMDVEAEDGPQIQEMDVD
ncbi:heat shock protein 70 family [Kockovaella imperatae]|uniref:Heat shock protein 70 family n=1 Tax=Kockovaella imperatae TaxID=4999 RepID=A0A1Y1UIR9_9TREE|nr:heat shock protein 70 family [Kockovaella imperatae]ORX37394.1 heat shock protein 70 family [Kockovaella imperatae]